MFSGKVLFSLTFFFPIIFYFSFSSPLRTVTAEATLEVPEADFYFFPCNSLGPVQRSVAEGRAEAGRREGREGGEEEEDEKRLT